MSDGMATAVRRPRIRGRNAIGDRVSPLPTVTFRDWFSAGGVVPTYMDDVLVGPSLEWETESQRKKKKNFKENEKQKKKRKKSDGKKEGGRKSAGSNTGRSREPAPTETARWTEIGRGVHERKMKRRRCRRCPVATRCLIVCTVRERV